MKAEIVGELMSIVGSEWVATDRAAILDYLTDETAPTVRPQPAGDVVLVKPHTPQEISNILKVSNRWKVPVYPRGGGTGLVGGCIPTRNGIVLSVERMNRVIELDRENLMIVAEAGVTLHQLINAVDKAGLLFPPHPGDETAQIGGLVACNAGGARAVKHGVMRNYVKGLEVVLPTGEILNLGGKLLKNVAGYDLMHLIIGSQGTLGVISKVILRLYPKVEEMATLIIPYKEHHDALRTVPSILQEGMLPLAIEFVDNALMDKSARQLGMKWPVKQGRTCLLIVVTGNTKEDVYLQAERIHVIAEKRGAIDTLIIENRRKQEDVLNIRNKIYSTLQPDTMDILDVAVPPTSIARLIDTLDEIAEKYSTYLPTFGHAGDGNLHNHIMMARAGGVEQIEFEMMKTEIYDAAINLGGTITAEHGIGKIRIRELNRYSSKKAIDIMKKIKEVFDPNNILNPQTVLPWDQDTMLHTGVIEEPF